jgi:hypothetical protein
LKIKINTAKAENKRFIKAQVVSFKPFMKRGGKSKRG